MPLSFSSGTAKSFGFASNTAIPPPVLQYLVVAGGGGGGSGGRGAGAGAGGLLAGTDYTATAGTPILITVGGGGTGGAPNIADYGTTGSNSVFGDIVTYGGGRGAPIYQLGGNGGSGGGNGAGSTYNAPAGRGVYPGSFYINAAVRQGYDGGKQDQSYYNSGGGGGAGGKGNDGSYFPSTHNNYIPANGGIGLESSISGTSKYYAGGGGGGQSTGPGTLGGTGGGGAGGGLSGTGGSGTANTGGGGGGGGVTSGGYQLAGGAGGSGVVIVSFTAEYTAPVTTTGNPTITTSGGRKIYTWTSSGSITF